MRIKIATYRRINKTREDPDQFGRAGSTITSPICARHSIKSVECVHENPAVKGLVENSVDWKRSLQLGIVNRNGPIEIDDARLPLKALDRI